MYFFYTIKFIFSTFTACYDKYEVELALIQWKILIL
jgi:hypothetical protein